jgi:predicted enzyme related to lactoylglutathione lyase
MANVSETFFALPVREMARATRFYVDGFAAEATFSSPEWTSLRLAGVRVALFLDGSAAPSLGLHFAVGDLAAACADVERAGGRVVNARVEPAPGVVLADVRDSEGNAITLTLRA